MNYPYSAELKVPARMPEIDPGKPAMAGMLKILRLTHEKKTEAFQPPEGVSCRKIQVPSADGTRIRCFVLEPGGAPERTPGLLMIHGGGFYLPVQVSALALACEYAAGLNIRVFLPEYRLVPDFTAPIQLDDCFAVWTAMERHGADPERLLVMGDSAGAALAAGLCIRLRDGNGPRPRGQLLIYPALDDRAERYESYEKYADACWSPRATRAMWDAYLGDADRTTLSFLIPARCEDLTGLPPAYIEPQQIDVLHDEAVAYAEALGLAGVPVRLNEIAGSYHGFDSDPDLPLVRKVMRQRMLAAGEFLRE